MDKKELLQTVAQKEYSTLSELVIEVARLIPYFAEKQKSDRVAIYPDERTIRYYINEGLVSKPKGTAKTFDYKHLLQVLAIKYLQSQFIPLNEIKKLLKEIKEEQMEQLLTKEEKLLSPKMLTPLGGVGLLSPIAGILAALGTTYLLKKKNGAKKEEQNRSVRWLHIPIIDKVELNIQEDYLPENAKDKDEFIDRLIARIRIYLQGEESKRKEEQ